MDRGKNPKIPFCVKMVHMCGAGMVSATKITPVSSLKTHELGWNVVGDRSFRDCTDFSEFWQRWHISLSSWLRDYLYIPLGGNKRGRFRTHVNFMTTMLLGGLWHGAAWTFVVWGGLHGTYLILQRLTSPFKEIVFRTVPGWVTTMLGMVVVFLAVDFTWIFFRAESFTDAVFIINHILAIDDVSFSVIRNKPSVVSGGLAIAILLIVDVLITRKRIIWLRTRPLAALVAIIALALIIAFTGNFSGSSFIYFQF